MNFIPFGTTTAEAIAALESELNITLPEDYKNFLLQNNGGRYEMQFGRMGASFLWTISKVGRKVRI
jgi:cell wall assembly regulator SMI1